MLKDIFKNCPYSIKYLDYSAKKCTNEDNSEEQTNIATYLMSSID